MIACADQPAILTNPELSMAVCNWVEHISVKTKHFLAHVISTRLNRDTLSEKQRNLGELKRSLTFVRDGKKLNANEKRYSKLQFGCLATLSNS